MVLGDDRSALPPPPAQPFEQSGGSLSSVVFDRAVPDAGKPHEIGRWFLLPLPQDAEASDAVADAILKACAEAGSVGLWERSVDGKLQYRGQRVLAEASRSVDGRVTLIFGPAPIDYGPALRGRGPTLLGNDPSGRSLLVRELNDAVLPGRVFSAGLESMLLLPVAARPPDRAKIYDEASRILARVRDDSAEWPAFADWFVRRRPTLDTVTLERILVMALSLPIDQAQVGSLAVAALNGVTPVDHEYCKRFAQLLAEFEDPAATHYAKTLLVAARSSFHDDPELDLASARVAAKESRHAEACRLYEHYVGSLTPEDFIAYVEASVWSESADAMRAALRRLDTVVAAADSRGLIHRLLPALRSAVEARRAVHEGIEDPLETLLQHLLAEDEREALALYRVAVRQFELTVSAQLRLLSTFELVEQPDVLRKFSS